MTRARLHVGEVAVDEALVRRLLVDQQPGWAGREVRRITSTGTSHAMFRLGDDLAIRMPRIGGAEQQVARESAWLPRLAPHLTVDVPVPVGVGEPGRGYPFRWMVSPWLPGRDLLELMTEGVDVDWRGLARDLARFLRSLQVIDVDGAPAPGKRGRELAARDEEVRTLIPALAGEFDAAHLVEIWGAALEADPWSAPPVWLHGDLLPGNVVLDDGRLAAVIDWSSTGVGDPACDLMIAWSLPAEARAELWTALEVNDATWARARGWVVEQAVAFIPYYESTVPTAVAVTRHRLAAALAER